MAFVERQNQSPIQLNKETIQMPIKDIIWHRVSMRGEFLNDKNIILDNQIREEKAGFLIYTPLKKVCIVTDWNVCDLQNECAYH